MPSNYHSSPIKYFLLFSAGFMLLYCNSREKKNVKSKQEKTQITDSFTKVTMSFAGDIMMHLPQITSALIEENSVYDFSSVFEKIAPKIKKADIAVGNIETTFGGMPYTGYPQFSAPDTLAWFLKEAGFDVMVTANNHSADRGAKGITGTIDVLEKYGFDYTGTFKNKQLRDSLYPLILEKNNIKIGLLNCTYGTNGLPVPSPLIVNDIDTSQIKTDAETARKRGAEIVILTIHWGTEYENEPNKQQKMLANWFLKNGVDVIMGSHPHVLQPAIWETYVPNNDSVSKKGLVVYSLGNFISNQRDRYRDGGMLFEFTISKNKFNNKIKVENAGYYPSWVYIQQEPKKYYILPAAEFENDTTFIKPVSAKTQMLQYLNDTRNHLNKHEGIKEMKM